MLNVRTRTEYSFRKAYGPINNLVDMAGEAMGIVDSGTWGHVPFNNACKKAGIDNFRFHDLRACFCTNALLSGMQIEQVAFLSGHKDWSQLKRYTRIKPEDLADKINNVVNIK